MNAMSFSFGAWLAEWLVLPYDADAVADLLDILVIGMAQSLVSY